MRVAEYLEEDFPALKSLLGPKRFEELVADYVAASPSRTRNARFFSSRLPEVMRESEKWRREALAIGVARLERALTDAFDAADGDSCALEALAAYAPQDWPRLVFAFHPSLRLISAPAGTVELYEALSSEGAAPQLEPSDEEEAVAVWRSGFDPAYRTLSADEFLALNEALAGKSFGGICQLVAFQERRGRRAGTPGAVSRQLVFRRARRRAQRGRRRSGFRGALERWTIRARPRRRPRARNARPLLRFSISVSMVGSPFIAREIASFVAS